MTGDRILDALMTKYGFRPHSSVSLIGMLVYVRSKGHVNCHELARRAMSAPCVEGAFPDLLVGGGDEIDVSKKGSRMLVTLSRGWGDCFGGCIHRRTHYIYVDDRFVVTYRGARTK